MHYTLSGNKQVPLPYCPRPGRFRERPKCSENRRSGFAVDMPQPAKSCRPAISLLAAIRVPLQLPICC